MDEGISLEQVKISLNISVLKLVHAKWLVEVCDELATDRNLIISAFVKTGIFDAL